MPSQGRLREEAQPFLREQLEARDDGPDDLVDDYDKRKSRKYDKDGKSQNRKRLVVAFLLSAILLVSLGVAVYEVVIYSNNPTQDNHGRVFKTAAVAADTEQCSTVGKSMLLKGGNAVDAAIATLLCSGLTVCHSMGIGGGFFMTVYNRTTGKATTIDARETAPGSATKDMFVPHPDNSSTGGLSIGVPGEIKGYWHTHQRYGHLPWKDLFQPAIKMAAEGFPVPKTLESALQDAKNILPPDFSEVFINPQTGTFYVTGEIMKRPNLAKTLRVLSEEGPDAFYNGTLTDDILSDLEDADSIITRDDLLTYSVLEKPPLEIQLADRTRVMSLPAPSGGPVLFFMLNMLDGYKLHPKDIASEDAKTLTYHRIAETFKFAYALRSNLGDEDFWPVKELVSNMTSRKFADYIRTHLVTDNTTHNTSYYGGTFYDRYTTATSHLSVIDQHGNAVSVTSTINGRFGSKRKGGRTGIIFNNEMDDFSSPNITNTWGIKPSPANFIVPGKRPLSSMVPTVMVDPKGDVVGVYGAAGGSRITTATAWVIAHTLWMGDDVQEAVERPRLHHQLLPPFLQHEVTFKDQTVLNGLKAKGHKLKSFPIYLSVSQAIKVNNAGPIGSKAHRIYACSDYRKGGIPDGF